MQGGLAQFLVCSVCLPVVVVSSRSTSTSLLQTSSGALSQKRYGNIDQQSPHGVTVFFTGFGSPDRADLMKKHVQWLRNQSDVALDCTILVYKPEADFQLNPIDYAPCVLKRHPGQWGEQLSASRPSTIRPWVLLWVDAVDIDPSTSLTRMIRVAQANQLDHLGISDGPNSAGLHITENRNRAGIGRRFYAPELQFDLLRYDAHKCLLSIMDDHVNPTGWGYDMVFPWACTVNQGVWDEIAWSHQAHSSYSHKLANLNQLKYEDKYEELGWRYIERYVSGDLADPDHTVGP